MYMSFMNLADSLPSPAFMKPLSQHSVLEKGVSQHSVLETARSLLEIARHGCRMGLHFVPHDLLNKQCAHASTPWAPSPMHACIQVSDVRGLINYYYTSMDPHLVLVNRALRMAAHSCAHLHLLLVLLHILVLSTVVRLCTSTSSSPPQTPLKQARQHPSSSRVPRSDHRRDPSRRGESGHHRYRLGQWLFGLPALMLPEFHSTHPDDYSWDPDWTGQGGTLALIKDAVSGRGPPPGPAGSEKWAAVRWKLDAAPYVGQRVELRGTLTVQGIKSPAAAHTVGAGIFVHVVDMFGVTLAADNMAYRRDISYSEISVPRSIVLDVPFVLPPVVLNACPLVGPSVIYVGFYLSGTSGRVKFGPPGWFKGVTTATLLTSDVTTTSGPGIW